MKQKTAALFLAAMLTLAWSAPAWCQADVTGFGKVKWGMKAATVRNLYKGSWGPAGIIKDDALWFADEKQLIKGCEFSVIFQFSGREGDARLLGVLLLADSDAVCPIQGDYSWVLDLVRQKYGPISERLRLNLAMTSFAESEKEESYQWYRPSGQIYLFVQEIGCLLVYRPRDPEADKF